jgi:hypothetical protein
MIFPPVRLQWGQTKAVKMNKGLKKCGEQREAQSLEMLHKPLAQGLDPAAANSLAAVAP